MSPDMLLSKMTKLSMDSPALKCGRTISPGASAGAPGSVIIALLPALVILLAVQSSAFAQRVGSFNRAVVARSLLNDHRADSAWTIVEKALAVDSLSAALWSVRARILALRGDRTGEQAALRRALTIDPEFLDAHQTLAEFYCDSGGADSARKYIALPLKNDASNPRVAYFNGRIYQQEGQLDSAVAIYARVYESLSASELLRVPVCPGYRLRTARLRTTDSGDIRLPLGNPTLLLFWATWSPQSLKAFKAITSQLPKAGITWRFLPVNVDDRRWLRSTRARVEAKARELGYKDPVPIDSGLLLFDRLGALCVPALVATDLAGGVDEIAFGWSESVSRLFIKGVLGSADSAPRQPRRSQSDCDLALRLLGASWHSPEDANPAWAIRETSRAVRTCSTSAYPYVLAASCRWQWADTLRARQNAYEALGADSTDPLGWLAVAELERRRNHLESSGQAVQRALQLDSSLATGWTIAGRLAAMTGDTLKVRQCISVLERVNRPDPGLQALKALILQQAGHLSEAAALWRELLDPRI
jgi:tetratricopeptide (TPR) repeat protein